MRPKKKLYHLLRPKEFRVYCRGGVPATLNVTRALSRCTCCSCLIEYQFATGKIMHPMVVKRVNAMRYPP